MAWGPLSGFLIGLFAVNWLHSLAHLLIGVGGLATFRSPDAAKAYALALAVAYALLFVLGLFGGACRAAGRAPAAQRMGQCVAPSDRADRFRSLLRLAGGAEARLALPLKNDFLANTWATEIGGPGVRDVLLACGDHRVRIPLLV